MENFIFMNPTELIFGKGQVKHIGKKVKEIGDKVLFIYGGGSIKKIGLYEEIKFYLNKKELKVFELAGIKPNPRVSKVREGVNICKEKEIDIILAVGGGSTIDTGKAISVCYFKNKDPWEVIKEDGEFNKKIPLGVILTLAATGSEMNPTAVISNSETNQKLAIHDSVFPSFSILDPKYTFSVPIEQTIYGIVDIAAHVYEQYFSPTPNTPLQDRWAESILKTLLKESEKVIENPENYDARANIMLCSTMALNGLLKMGKKGDFASHLIEHELSAEYDIPHGGGLAIIFPNWMKYVLDEGHDKFVQYATRVFGVDQKGKTEIDIAKEGIERTREWFNDLGAPAKLSDYDIGDEKFDIMAEKAVKNGPLGSYKKLHKDDIVDLLNLCL